MAFYNGSFDPINASEGRPWRSVTTVPYMLQAAVSSNACEAVPAFAFAPNAEYTAFRTDQRLRLRLHSVTVGRPAVKVHVLSRRGPPLVFSGMKVSRADGALSCHGGAVLLPAIRPPDES